MARTRPALAVGLAAALAGPAAATDAGWVLEDAIVVRMTEADLGLLVREAFDAGGGGRMQGSRASAGRGLKDLSYTARLSPPRLELGDAGRARLDFEISEASVRLGSVERRLLGTRAICEGLGVELAPGRTLAVELALRLAVEGDRLTVTPDAVSAPAEQAFEVQRPERCRALVPTWLLWWLGKPQLRRKLAGLDELLLERAVETAAELDRRGGLVRPSLTLDPVGGRGEPREVRLVPRRLATDAAALELALAATAGTVETATARAERLRPPPELRAGVSSLAVSERLIDRLLEIALPGGPGQPRRAGEKWRRVLASEAFRALVPGLERLDAPDALRVSLGLHAPPRVRFVEDVPGGTAAVRIEIDGIELGFWSQPPGLPEPERLGTVEIDAARLTVVPYTSPLGGVSLELVENDWRVSAHGLAVDAPLLAATLQELVFGELFETRYDPFAREGLPVAASSFAPSRFAVAGGFLVLEFVPAEPPLLHANR